MKIRNNIQQILKTNFYNVFQIKLIINIANNIVC